VRDATLELKQPNPRAMMEEAFKFNVKHSKIVSITDKGESSLKKTMAMAQALEQ